MIIAEAIEMRIAQQQGYKTEPRQLMGLLPNPTNGEVCVCG